MADGATNNRIAAIRSVLTLEALYEEVSNISVTPGWCWHEHWHDGDEPAHWSGGLDVPLVRTLDRGFFAIQRSAVSAVRHNCANSRLSSRGARAGAR